MAAKRSERLRVTLRRLDEPDLWESTVHVRGRDVRATARLRPRSPAVIADLERLSRGPAEAELRRIGRMLFRTLFPGVLADHWLAACADADEVAVALHLPPSEAGELLDLPWEALHDGTRHCLADERVSFVRVLQKNAAVAAAERVNVLVAVSSPSDLRDPWTLHNEAEVTMLMRAVAPMRGAAAISFEFLPIASLEAIERRLSAGGVDIVHFIGHGAFDEASTTSLLLLEREGTGRAVAVTAERVAAAVAAATPKLVVLNACDTAASSPVAPATGLAWQLVARGCPAVVAMRAAVGERTATTFSAALYRGIAAGEALERAVASARRECGAIAIPLLIQQNDAPVALVSARAAAEETTAAAATFERPLRAADADRLLRLLRTTRPRAVCIIGPRHSGKSTVIDAVASGLRDRGSIERALPLRSLDATPEPDGPTAWIVDVGRQLVSAEAVANAAARLPAGDLLLVEGGVCGPFPPSVVSYYLGAWPVDDVLRLATRQVPALPFSTLQSILAAFGPNPEIVRRLGAAMSHGRSITDVLEEVMGAYVDEVGPDEPPAPTSNKLAVWLSFFESPVAKSEVTGIGTRVLDLGPETIGDVLARGLAMSAGGGSDERLVATPWLKRWLNVLPHPETRSSFHALCAAVLKARADQSMHDTLELASHMEAAGNPEHAFWVRLSTLDELLNVNPTASLALATDLLQHADRFGDARQRTVARVQLEACVGHAAAILFDDDRASDAYHRAIAVVDAARDTDGYDYLLVLKADCVSGLAEYEMRKQSPDLARAHDWLMEASAAYEAKGDNRASTQMLIRRANLAARRHDRGEFDDLSSRAIAAAEILGQTDVLTDALVIAGRGRRQFEDYDRALEMLERAFATGRQLRNLQLANAAHFLAEALIDRDLHASRVSALLNEAKSIYLSLGLLEGVAHCESQLGSLAAAHGDLPELAAADLRALRLLELLGDDRVENVRKRLTDLAPELVRIGDIFLDEGRYHDASRFFEAAATLREIDPEKALYAIIRGGIAESEAGRFARAEALFNDAREEALRTGNPPKAAEALHELGTIAVHRDDLDSAVELLTQCLQEKEAIESADRFSTLHALAIVHDKRGEKEEAIALMRQCVDGTSRDQSPMAWIASALQLATFLVNIGRPGEAEPLAAGALETARSMSAGAGIAHSSYLLGWITRLRGEAGTAREHFERARSIGRELDLGLVAAVDQALQELGGSSS